MWVIILLMMFALVVGISTGLKLRTPNSQQETMVSSGQARTDLPGYLSDPANHQTHDPLWPRISEVAGHFLCGCGQCGDMTLVECICDMPNGGIREKAYIREQLVSGVPVQDVVTLVQERFGRRIPAQEDIDRAGPSGG
ncbi:hypothetical protein KQH29_00255 [bacterium]|nr:hypothetical protein [bacterium]